MKQILSLLLVAIVFALVFTLGFAQDVFPDYGRLIEENKKAEAAEVSHTESDAASTLRSDALDSSYQVALSVGVEAAEQLQEYKVD